MKYKNIKGLSDKEVEASRRSDGTNELPPPEIESFWDKLKENFEDPIIRILLVALGITLVLAFLGYADWVEGFGIFVAVFLATFVSTWSEYKNESSFRTLQEQASKVQSTVFRNGVLVKLPANDIVVGDYVLLQAGDKVPADGKLVEGELQVNQASLTGETNPVRKKIAPSNYKPKEKSDFYDEHVCFRGSVVDDGEGVFVVVKVGKDTSYGELYTELSQSEERDSPLKVKLSDLADAVAYFGYIGATAIAISFLFKQFVIDNKYNTEAILKYVSLANWHAVLHDVVTSVILAIIVIVVAVPEGLPMMIAIVLSLNMRKLLKDNVLVRKLVGIETAGSIDILFVDKTGTLTKGIFEPKCFISGDGASYSDFKTIPNKLKQMLGFAIRESTSAFVSETGATVGGNASDRALLAFLDKETRVAKEDCTHEKDILFNSQRKFSAVQLGIPSTHQDLFFAKNKSLTIVKGAPEMVIANCKFSFTDDGKQVNINVDKLQDQIDLISKKGVRVVAIAASDVKIQDESIPSPLTLIGVVGIEDEIRKESKPAIELAQKAGIQVVMITGDRMETAHSVAKELGLLQGNKQVLMSNQLQSLTDEQLQDKLSSIGMIARALPTDKSRLVRLSQALGRVVGMTGDGVNDSAALKKADVGFAMGSGSEVAKEASDIVIIDDNFESITRAVLYGRTIFKSIRKFIVFQSTVNCASFLIVFMGPFLGFDFPLTLIQLLWVNLVMDTLAALAFGGEPALKTTMSEPPVKRDARIINPYMWSSILTNGIFIASLCILSLTSPSIKGFFVRDGKPSDPVFFTAFFAFFIFLTNFNSFNARTPSTNIFNHIWENQRFVFVVALIFTVQVTFTYVGGSVLRTVGLTTTEWALIIGASAIIIPFDIVRKTIMKQLNLKAEL